MKDTTTYNLALSLENGDFDKVKFEDFTDEQKENMIASLKFASERVGIEVVVE